MQRNFKKFVIASLAVLTLLGGLVISVQASGTRSVVVNAAIIFHSSSAAAANAGQIHRGARMANTSLLSNNRRSGFIMNSTAANGWGGRTMYTHHTNLSGTIPPGETQ